MPNNSEAVFREIFRECAPDGAVLSIHNGAASATITASCGETLTACGLVCDPARHVSANAAKLAITLWEFTEAHGSAVRLRELRAEAKRIGIEIAQLERKADCGFMLRHA